MVDTLYLIRRGLLKAIRANSSYMKGRMMDFGCGSKPYQSLFTVEEYIGVDFKGAGHSHIKEHIDVFYNGKELPFPNNHFDAVFSSEVFEHIFNLEEILQELHRVMKKDAFLLFTCPFAWNEHEVPVDFARYTQFALTHLLEKHGFKVIKTEKTGNFWLTLVQLFQLYLPIPKIIRIIPFLRKSIIFLINFFGLIFNKIFPKRYDLYLNNIIIAQK